MLFGDLREAVKAILGIVNLKGTSKKPLLELGAAIFLRDKAPRIQAQLGYVSSLATQQRPVCVQNTHRQAEKSMPKTEWGFRGALSCFNRYLSVFQAICMYRSSLT